MVPIQLSQVQLRQPANSTSRWRYKSGWLSLWRTVAQQGGIHADSEGIVGISADEDSLGARVSALGLAFTGFLGPAQAWVERCVFDLNTHTWLETDATIPAAIRRELARLSREFSFCESRPSALVPQARDYDGQVSVTRAGS